MKLQDFDFRVWDIQRQEYALCEDGYESMDGERCGDMCIEIRKFKSYMQMSSEGEKGYYQNIEKAEIELYTGLKDKNGVKIFVGDILELKCGFKRDIFEVCFSLFEGVSIDKAGSSKNAKISLMLEDYDEWKEFASVIGNIHENADLFKQG
ncbi:hypothetical protein DMB95_09395 [Campylobacter sp. MIT 12-8780]|uniref:YopX family protein n=1 Tax=unclassified Campylobacter TaxID=2593542 RepID=UPI0010F989F0|nr:MULTISPECIES: YopX family protein [unclassified Campylobacter]NDJ28182.1 hypothetical protein [Campylobacter sp. MIT 19-121]TKX28259.1 hypothetical protein CQA38_08405 [Campylobacter sp. MIT 12-5580]TQR39993.1 hypothetical protein DMB95_09395 [Campylobacter sp. MIT 12-8780]